MALFVFVGHPFRFKLVLLGSSFFGWVSLPWSSRYHETVSQYNGAFTLDVKSVLDENLAGILVGIEC